MSKIESKNFFITQKKKKNTSSIEIMKHVHHIYLILYIGNELIELKKERKV